MIAYITPAFVIGFCIVIFLIAVLLSVRGFIHDWGMEVEVWGEEQDREMQARINSPRTNHDGLFRNRTNFKDALDRTYKFKNGKRKKANLVKIFKIGESTTCPLCMESLDDKISTCSECSTKAHTECLVEMSGGNCPILGCKKPIKLSS